MDTTRRAGCELSVSSEQKCYVLSIYAVSYRQSFHNQLLSIWLCFLIVTIHWFHPVQCLSMAKMNTLILRNTHRMTNLTFTEIRWGCFCIFWLPCIAYFVGMSYNLISLSKKLKTYLVLCTDRWSIIYYPHSDGKINFKAKYNRTPLWVHGVSRLW